MNKTMRAQESREFLQEKLDFIDTIMSRPYSRMDAKQWRGIFHTFIDKRNSLKSTELRVLGHYRWRWKQRYDKSHIWKGVRENFLSSVDNTCQQCCGVATQVHHLTYVRCGGKEIPEDLMAVCKPCHGKEHGY